MCCFICEQRLLKEFHVNYLALKREQRKSKGLFKLLGFGRHSMG